MTEQRLVTEGIVTLFQLNMSHVGGPWHYFTSASDFDHDIYWGGQRYAPLPMTATGYESTTRGPIPQPTITISNLYGAGNLLIDSYAGLIGAEVNRIITLARFLDGGATPDPNAYISLDKFVVAQKMSHTAAAIAFKLASRMDQEGAQIPARLVLRDVCSHVYRIWNESIGGFDYSKATCPYTAPRYYDTNNTPTGPQSDACSKDFIGCSNRFGSAAGGGGILPARFFPGVGRVK